VLLSHGHSTTYLVSITVHEEDYWQSVVCFAVG
jgi:hypothetical protein